MDVYLTTGPHSAMFCSTHILHENLRVTVNVGNVFLHSNVTTLIISFFPMF